MRFRDWLNGCVVYNILLDWSPASVQLSSSTIARIMSYLKVAAKGIHTKARKRAGASFLYKIDFPLSVAWDEYSLHRSLICVPLTCYCQEVKRARLRKSASIMLRPIHI